MAAKEKAKTEESQPQREFRQGEQQPIWHLMYFFSLRTFNF
jgi:hypothetical protein